MRIRATLPLALAATAALGLSACGDSESADPGVSSAASSAPSAAAAPTPVANITSLTGQSTAVTLAPSFVQGLTTLQLTPGTVGTAKIDGGVATFPITGGNVKYFTPGSTMPYVQGSIQHTGSGLSLTGGGTTVELTDFVVDPGGSVLTGKVTANGAVAAPSAPLFFLDGSTLKPLQTGAGNTAVLEGTTVSLTKEAADLLNKTFGTTALTQYFPVGVAKITVNTQ